MCLENIIKLFKNGFGLLVFMEIGRSKFKLFLGEGVFFLGFGKFSKYFFKGNE